MEESEKIQRKRPGLRDWCLASRPQYYIATVIPITLGFVLAARDTGSWNLLAFLLVLLASFFIHLATNLANDLFDEEAGVDTNQTIGGSVASREGRITPRDYKLALLTLYGLSLLLAPFIIIPSGEPVLWLFAGFGIFSSIYYTAPPLRFGYRAMGEALVFLNMGVIMLCGAYMACAHGFRLYVLAYAIIVGFMVAAILYFQTLPEIVTDGAAGKRTLAVRLGIGRAFFLYHFWWPLVWLLITMLWLTGVADMAVFGWIFAIPFYWLAIKALRQTTTDNLLALDAKGYLTRLMYVLTGIFLVIGAGLG